MGTFALFLGVLGGVCGAMGVLIAVEAVPSLGAALTPMFWLAVSAVLFLASIASLLSRGGQS